MSKFSVPAEKGKAVKTVISVKTAKPIETSLSFIMQIALQRKEG